MEFLKGVPSIKIMNSKHDCSIESMQSFDEDETRLILKCAENMQYFERGFVCDMECRLNIVDNQGRTTGIRVDIVKGLVLLYIHKSMDMDSVPTFTYVFYK